MYRVIQPISVSKRSFDAVRDKRRKPNHTDTLSDVNKEI
jgi:hypothetical protein